MKRSVRHLLLLSVVTVLVTGMTWAFRDSDDTIDVVAEFDNAAGLYVGNAVSILGMPVGEVTRITPRASSVEVAMSIDSNQPVAADVTAVTVSTSVLTDRHVELTPPYRSGPQLASGQLIPLSHTRTPVEVDRALAMADKLSVSLGGDGEGSGPVASLLDSAAAITDGNGADIRSALTAMSEAVALGPDNGASTRDAITTIVDDLSQLSDAAARNDATIRSFGSSLQQISHLFASERIGWGRTGAQLNTIIAEMTDLLEKRRGDLAHTVDSANAVTKTLADYRRSLAEFLDVTPLLMDNAYNVVNQQLGVARVHAQLDKVALDGQLVKEVCNVLGLRELGCATGTLRDFGPDFGVSAMLNGLAGEPQ